MHKQSGHYDQFQNDSESGENSGSKKLRPGVGSRGNYCRSGKCTITNRAQFLYLLFMQSQSKIIHEWAERLYRNNGLAENDDFDLRHKAITDRFGRYPHRTKILGREATADEVEFLEQPGSSF